MQLTKNFTLQELIKSDYAHKHSLNNSPSPEVSAELFITANVLQKIRDYLSEKKGHEIPLIVTSCYRSLKVNRGIGSHDKSDHLFGYAADFKSTELTPYEICKIIEPKLDEFGIGQLINEPSWVHISRKKPPKENNRILTINKYGIHLGIIESI